MKQWYRKLVDWLPPLPTPPPSHPAKRETLLVLAAIIGIAVLMHFQIADAKIASFAVFIFALKVAAIARNAKPPNRLAVALLSIIGLGAVVVLYGGWNGQRAGISFLVLLLTLKFLESVSLRDYFVVCLILYFLAASTFLFDSSIVSIVVVSVYTLAITAILFQLSDPNPPGILQSTKMSAGIVARAIPLALILFFFFPRISGDFGFIESQDQRDTSGLSDALVAGEMATSAFDDSRAFIVEFSSGVIPSRNNLYWRSKVMPIESAFSWELAPFDSYDIELAKRMREASSIKTDASPNDIQYEILHEPSTDSFLPYLDYVATTGLGKVLPDYSVAFKNKGAGEFSYTGRSTLSQSLGNQHGMDNPQYLAVESQPSARILALLAKWSKDQPSEEQLIQRVLNHFRTGDYTYSLTPNALDERDRMDDFIFDSKEGYCEHYASAFTIFMRWLRIPARVVVGYQGGTIIGEVSENPILEVKYRDAHAWSEVWLNDQWVRVDPTSTVSQERIDYGMEALLELWYSDALGSTNSGTALANFLNPSGVSKFMRQVSDGWARINYEWDKWIVNYDSDTQRELLESFGIKAKNQLVTLVGILLAATLALLLFYFYKLIPKAVKRSQEELLYLRFLNQFKKLKIEKSPSETPLEFAKKAAALIPEKNKEIMRITHAYLEMRFGNDNNEKKQDSFKHMVKKFKLQTSTLSQ